MMCRMCRVLVVAAFGLALVPACAKEPVDRPVTTSGDVYTSKPACAHAEHDCTTNNDCCSLWCVAGVCEERRQP